jgi:hypothetical protein
MQYNSRSTIQTVTNPSPVASTFPPPTHPQPLPNRSKRDEACEREGVLWGKRERGERGGDEGREGEG